MSLRSMLQTVPFISHQKKQKGKTVLKHYLHLNLTIHATRDCVFLFGQFQPWSDLVLRKSYQRENNMMTKQLFTSLRHGLLTFLPLINLYFLYFVFIKVCTLKL